MKLYLIFIKLVLELGSRSRRITPPVLVRAATFRLYVQILFHARWENRMPGLFWPPPNPFILHRHTLNQRETDVKAKNSSRHSRHSMWMIHRIFYDPSQQWCRFMFCFRGRNSWVFDSNGSVPVADLSGARDVCPGSKFFQFHAVFGKILQNRMLAPPPRGNPGSATVFAVSVC